MSSASVPAVPPEVQEHAAVSPRIIGIPALAAVAAVTALGDFLLYAHTPGLGLVLFLAAVAAAALVTNCVRASRRVALCAVGVLVAGLLPFAVNPSILSFLFAVGSVMLFATLLFAGPTLLISDIADAARSMVLSWPYRAPADLCLSVASAASKRPKSITSTLVVWLMPITLGVVFATLFVGANPLLEAWVAAVDLPAVIRRIADALDGVRIGFWLLTIVLVWPVLFVREYRRRGARTRTAAPDITRAAASSTPMRIVGQAAILRSLIVFNVLFAVQTALDGLYLWGGVALPRGMTHAEYAHRGAYPLIVTALLAAAFVVMALRPGSETERSPLIRGLVYLWIGQNVWLVISSILRLDLYVEAYSLTYWRVAAFIWMVLVAIGLVLIVMRIIRCRSNAWLISANLVSLTAVLYLCAFARFASIIADYNVAHSAELGGGGPALDRAYLHSLGAHAIPAADTFAARTLGTLGDSRSSLEGRDRFQEAREKAAIALVRKMHDWRAWNYWDWRLAQYLAAHPAPAPAAPATTPPAD